MNARPYPGLRPFRRQEAHLFFGRERQIEQVCKKLARTRLVSVVGVSGCGKSSLVRAGVLPALERDEHTNWRIVTLHPGSRPFQHLAQALLDHSILQQSLLPLLSEKADTREARHNALREILLAHPLSFTDLLRDAQLPKNSRILLVVDQFEELLRLPQIEASAFVNILLAAVRQKELSVSLLLTMRSDVIGECARFQGLPERINVGQFLVPQLTRQQLRDAICKPAKILGGKVDERLMLQLLRELGNDTNRLPVLQHCLMRMWDVASQSLKNQGSSELSLSIEQHQAVGGLQHALSRHADEAYSELDEHGQRIAEIMFRCLSERGPDQQDTRRPTTLQEIAAVAGVPVSEVQIVSEIFRRSDRCFLTPPVGTPLEPDTVLDISHESLIQRWDRLNSWASEEARSAEIYRRLEQTARLWKAGEAALWTTPDLEHALDWEARNHPTAAWAQRYCLPPPQSETPSATPSESESSEESSLSEQIRERDDSSPASCTTGFEIASEFLETSAQAQEEQRTQEIREHRKALRRARWQLAWVSFGLVLVIAISLWGWKERRNREQVAQEKTVVEAEKQDVLDEQAEFVKFISDHLHSAQRSLTTGTQVTQAVLRSLIQDYLPNWDREFEIELRTIYKYIEALNTDFKRERISQELERVNQLPLKTADWQNSNILSSDTAYIYNVNQQTTDLMKENVLWLMGEVWNTGVEVARLEIQKMLYEFRNSVLLPLERNDLSESFDRDVFLERINKAVYVLLLEIQDLPVTFNHIQDLPLLSSQRIKDFYFQGTSWYDIEVRMSEDFKEGKIPWNLDYDIAELRHKAQEFEQQFQDNVVQIYAMGQQAEQTNIKKLLQEQEQELVNISDDVERLNKLYEVSQKEKAAAFRTMTTKATTAFDAYNDVITTFTTLQGYIDACAAESAYQQRRYEDSVRLALHAFAVSFDIESAYTSLIFRYIDFMNILLLQPNFCI